MKHEARVFFTALMFYTRLPCPAWVGHSEELMNQSTRYFPLIGWIVGAAGAAVLYWSSFVFSPFIAAVLSVVATVLITGAFHEDGFADMCDGFGGGWTKARILDIMKDSRLGTYGAVGLLLLIGLKVAATVQLITLLPPAMLAMVIVLSHVLSRLAAVTVIYTHAYSRADASSKVKPVAKRLATRDLLIATAFVLPLFLVLGRPVFLLVIVPVYLGKIYLAAFFQRWIDGYTGDCLGAVQQVTEVVTLLTFIALWSLR